jgi:MYXO-CTERM domain-containing protein
MRRIAPIVAGVAVATMAGAASAALLDFEGSTLGSMSFAVGTIDAYHCDLGIDYRPTITGGVSSFGMAMITASGDAGGSGNELFLSNALAEVEHGETLENVSFIFGDFGSDVNLSFNGQSNVANNFVDFNGLEFGGATVTVSGNAVSIDGPGTELSIGGLPVVIDDLYFDIATVPTPGAVSLAGVAGLVMVRRRR